MEFKRAIQPRPRIYFDGALPNRIRLYVDGHVTAELTIAECEWLVQNIDVQLAHNCSVTRQTESDES